MRRDVAVQARQHDKIAFDIVKIDNAVVNTLLAQPAPPFRRRFRPYHPPPKLKIAVGDEVGVVIWEAASNGLFGNSLTELSLPPGAATLAKTGLGTSLSGVPGMPIGASPSADLLGLISGGGQQAGTSTTSGGESGNAAAAALGASGNAGETLGGAGSTGTGALGGAGSTGTGALGGAGNAGTGALGEAANSGSAALGSSANGGSATFGGAALAGGGAGGSSARLQRLIDLATQSGRAGTRIPDQFVGSDGAISIPYGGRVRVAGRTPEQVERRITALLAHKALDPQVLVVVKRSFANSVTVTGHYIRGTRVRLSPGGDRLLQVIAAAGGTPAPIHDTFVRLSRGGVTATVPLARLVADPAQDIYARPGDVLTLTMHPQTFSVFGAAGQNAAIAFHTARLSLAEALARAGGLNDNRADPRAVFLFRYEPVSLVRRLGQPIASDAYDGLSPIVYRLDLKQAGAYALAQRFPVHDRDIIFISDAKTQPIYRFFNVLSTLTGAISTGFVTCHATGC